MPTSATTYWCSNFTLPVIPGGANIVGVSKTAGEIETFGNSRSSAVRSHRDARK